MEPPPFTGDNREMQVSDMGTVPKLPARHHVCQSGLTNELMGDLKSEFGRGSSLTSITKVLGYLLSFESSKHHNTFEHKEMRGSHLVYVWDIRLPYTLLICK
ncbi:hypothetical protein CAPTEDRAFT_201395 [Capitella teleta]|uniref:Uncharacterized protein n=1 Tax=Capitella teleta TaxID=283909 RepID=R7TQ64_CAPTE|nr:hypothetical protein CAPTEDRAFT_201395 [Capitella teleta]|eukprot:ELT93175.1 hypothetical protein CAPTEDRAFT_201395 [Capitella teleta]